MYLPKAGKKQRNRKRCSRHKAMLKARNNRRRRSLQK